MRPAATHRALLITGASRGIGAATALRAAAAGWDVAVNCARDLGAAGGTHLHRNGLGRRALVVQADVADEAAVLAMFGRIDAELGVLGGLVNNAGVVDAAARVDAMSVSRLQRMFAINVIGSMVCAREALLRMSTRHGGAGGVIVNLSSAAARLGSPGQYVDYAAEGVRVNGVRPGIIATDIHASGGEPDRAERLAPMVPMQRAGTADEVAAAIVWLLSAEASYVTGTTIDVAGGR
jgi:NAD(P)-dependent dehydrogenase (short-subunit alcohol dehydrogenase family)